MFWYNPDTALCRLGGGSLLFLGFFELSKSGLKNITNVTYYQTDNLELEFIDPPKVSWCLDGEELKTAKTKFNFSVNRRIKMLLPKENIKKLFEEE